MEKKQEIPEIWGGIECTINRVGNRYFDQLQLSGHYDRAEDIDAICATGIKLIRYPVLWERHQPEASRVPDFSLVRSRLEKLAGNNIGIIAGLVHHGSGPSYTSLLDENFPGFLAAYAATVAENFPFIEYYTPVNEPLTTARFSGLYGLWYPHKTNDVSFLKMLLNELKGTVLAMEAIRKVNPDAKLVQTEDLSKTYSTPLLQYQASFENQRRWLTYDILCGKFWKDHPLWMYFMRLGFSEHELAFFRDNPCPPQVAGVNYYVTSERYLDEDLTKYPTATHGGNTIHQYADVEAVRVDFEGPSGFQHLVTEMWNRYKIPVAVTEVHLHCAREEQLIWFKEIFDDCRELMARGIDLRGVTSWAMLGSYGWNKLLTAPPFEYERGAFDVSSGKPRPTAMAGLLKKLVEGGDFQSPATTKKGWWKQQSRFFDRKIHKPYPGLHKHSQPVMIIGKRGTLGKAFATICEERNLNYVLLGRDDINICCYDDIERAIVKYDPWTIINAAGFVRVDDAENERMRCLQENTNGPRQLAMACRRFGIKFLTYSSDLVFNGRKKEAYIESDQVHPLNVYGLSKAKAETIVARIHPSSLIVRTSSFFGPWDEYNFIHYVLKEISEGRRVEAVDDVFVTPTYVPHLVNASIDLLIDEEKGIWHLTNYDKVSWYEFATAAAGKAGYDKDLITPVSGFAWKALRPVNSALSSEKGFFLPGLDAAMNQFMESRALTI